MCQRYAMSTVAVILPLWLGLMSRPCPAQPASVRAFGAVGDGQADDTAAIQRAVDAKVGGVRFSRGVYRLTRPVVIELDRVGFTSLVGDGTARVVMAGPGPAFRFVGTHQGTASPSTVKDNVWQRQRTPMVSGLEIVGAHAEACGIEATGTMKMTVSRLTVRKTLHAIHLVDRNRNVTIEQCHLYDNRGIGLFLDHVNLHQINVANCHISYNRGGGIVVRGGNVRNLQVGTCDIEGNMSPDMPATANVLLDATGGSIGEVAITGCTIQHDHRAPGSANIRVIGLSDARPFTDERRHGHVTIVGNVLSDVEINIDLRSVRGAIITGNTMWKGYQYNLRVLDSAHVVVGPNVLDRNPRYNYGDGAKSANAVLFRNCQDATITGLHIAGVHHAPAGVTLENCRRFNVTNCTILDCDNVGLLLTDVSHTRISGCLIRDDRPDTTNPIAIRLTSGKGNLIADNLVRGKNDIAPGTAQVEGVRIAK